MFSKEKLAETREVIYVSKRLLLFLWQTDKLLLVGNLITVSIPAVNPFVNAYTYKLIIDLIVTSQNSTFDYQLLYKLLTLRFVTLVVQYFGFSLQNYMDTLIWTKIPVNLYQLILSKLAALDVQYFENSKFKDTLQRVKEGYIWRPLNLYSSLFFAFQSVLQLTIAAVALATLNWTLTAAILLSAVPAFIVQIYYSKTQWGVWAQNSPYRKKFWYLSELIQGKEGIKEMKIFQTASKFLGEIQSMQRKFAKENISVGQKRLLISSVFNLVGSAVAIGIETFIILTTIAGKISLGSLSYFTFVVFNFQSSASGFFANLASVFNNALYVKDIIKVLDMPKAITSVEKPIKIDTTTPPKIEFKNVTFSYPNSKQKVLDGLSFTIVPGEKVALVGANGAGKTTIIKLLARFYDVTGGQILINGIDIKSIDLNSWYKMLGVIFQDFIKYEYTLGENIHFGKIWQSYDLEEITKAAKMAGVDKMANKKIKYDQVLGSTFEGGVELSHGQWQKVALARAFLRDAPILILDEPTASIDAKSEKEIFDKVEKLSEDKTVVIISHRFSTVKNADMIYVIEKGKVEQSGNHQSLLNKNGTYAELFKIQASRYK